MLGQGVKEAMLVWGSQPPFSGICPPVPQGVSKLVEVSHSGEKGAEVRVPPGENQPWSWTPLPGDSLREAPGTQARAARGRHAGPSSESAARPSTQARACPLMERGPVPGKPDTPEKAGLLWGQGGGLCVGTCRAEREDPDVQGACLFPPSELLSFGGGGGGGRPEA